MNTTVSASMEGVERLPLQMFTEKAYFEYAMYVILDRALPHVGDGLKPVQRRIVYAMSELGLNATAKYKKSARTVGDVLGKFHPHGDGACYEAMVLLAQPFSCRYPLIDGQGNWGMPDDPKSFAAMRYTECRLSPYAGILLSELGQGTVDWQANFDGSLKEPSLLPARLPNVLINGASGIAVGMATDIPPHNLREVVEACIYLLDHPQADTAALCQFIKGPDFPTEAEIITPVTEIAKIYASGGGSLRMRAAWYRENGDIVIHALPHQVSGAKVLEQVAGQMQAKKLPMVVDVRDESDHDDPVRLVVVPRSNRVDAETLMAHLFATTDLERTYRVNLNVIGLNGRPQVHNLVQLLGEWLQYRRETVRRRLRYRLDKVLARLHLLEGLFIVFSHLDEVITIIREAKHPKTKLMQRFNLSELQANAILEMRLRQLARLEENNLRAEQKQLDRERKQLEKILASSTRLKNLIRKELVSDADKYGDDRRSPIVQRREAQAMSRKEIIPSEPVTVILSANGWVRAAKGHDIDPDRLNFKAGDQLLATAHGRNLQAALFLDSTGRAYALPAHSLPSVRSQGEPLTGRLNPPPGARFITVLMGEPEEHLMLASDAGYGFITTLAALNTKNRGGKTLLTLPSQAHPLPPQPVSNIDTSHGIAISSEGYMLIFPLAQLPELDRGKGNKIMGIPAASLKNRQEYLKHLEVLPAGGHLVVHAGKRQLTLKTANLQNFFGERGRRGRKLPRGYRNVDRLKVMQPPDPIPSQTT